MTQPFHFRMELGPGSPDLRLCLLSGQVFRFQNESSDVLVGAEGCRAWRIELDEGGAWVHSTHPAESLHGLLGLADDLPAILSQVRAAAPELARELALLPGLRLLRPSDPAESLMAFVCSANNTLHRIMPMVRRLASRGPFLPEGPWGRQHAFPDLDVLAGLDQEELRREGFGYRAPLVVEAARHASERGGREWLRALALLPHEEARQDLMAIPGIGPKLADCICLFGLGQQEAVPVDTHVWQAACRIWRPEWLDKSPTPARTEAVRRLFRDRFGPLAGWAQQLLYSYQLVQKRRDLAPFPPPRQDA